MSWSQEPYERAPEETVQAPSPPPVPPEAIEPGERRAAPAAGGSEKSVMRDVWKEWIRPFLIVLIAVSTFRSAVADWNDVPTGSMKPSILPGERIFVNKIAYDLKIPFTRVRLAQWDDPQRGDVVVFDSPADGRLLVKRVIGVPGDLVAMRDNALLIDDQPLAYSALDARATATSALEQQANWFATEHLPGARHPVMVSRTEHPAPNFGPIRVPDGRYLMLGDNRDHSADSRFFGFVPRQAIRGRAIAVIASFDAERGFLPRSDRFLHELN